MLLFQYTGSLFISELCFLFCRPIVGIFASLCFCYIWLNHLDLPNPAEIHSYSIGVTAFSLAAILEMTIEPLFIIGQAQLYVRFKVKQCR